MNLLEFGFATNNLKKKGHFIMFVVAYYSFSNPTVFSCKDEEEAQKTIEYLYKDLLTSKIDDSFNPIVFSECHELYARVDYLDGTFVSYEVADDMRTPDFLYKK